MCAKRLSTSWFPSPMVDSFSKWGFEMELLVVTAFERFHDCGDIFRKASAPVYAGTPAGDLGFACLSLERRLGRALDGHQAGRPAATAQRPPGVGDRGAGLRMPYCSSKEGTEGRAPEPCVRGTWGRRRVLALQDGKQSDFLQHYSVHLPRKHQSAHL